MSLPDRGSTLRPSMRVLVHNVQTGGRWMVVQTITTHIGPFMARADAETFADHLSRKEQP